MHEPMLIIELESHTTANADIIVSNHRAASGEGLPNRTFCVGALAPDGVIRLVDWGYATAEAARTVWPDAQHTAEFRARS